MVQELYRLSDFRMSCLEIERFQFFRNGIRSQQMWVIFPYHPLLHSVGLNSLLKTFSSGENRKLLQNGLLSIIIPEIRIGYAMQQKPFGSSLVKWH